MNEKEIALKAHQIREHILEMLIEAGSGHTAGPLDLADIMATLYFSELKYDPANPHWEGRDLLIMSNGHAVPVQYVAMALAGYFPISELSTLRKFGSRLQGHPERTKLPGLENTSGPLGSGISQAAGMAQSISNDRTVFCITGDGELQEGNIWEAAMYASKYKLGNLTVIVDRNHIQIDGNTEDVMPLGDLAQKFAAFNWHTLVIDGHNISQIQTAINSSRNVTYAPTVIIAKTIAGKGVDFMEFDYHWHGYDPNPKDDLTYTEALKRLRSLDSKIESDHD